MILAQRRKAVAAAGENLVGICLMTDVPHNLVPRRVEDLVEGKSQFHNSQAWTQVSAHLGDHRDDVLANLSSQLAQLFDAEWLEIVRGVDSGKQGFDGCVFPDGFPPFGDPARDGDIQPTGQRIVHQFLRILA
jgi:hypothetical protein